MKPSGTICPRRSSRSEGPHRRGAASTRRDFSPRNLLGLKRTTLGALLLCMTRLAVAGQLQQQINLAAPGDTLRIAAGTYRESITINKPLTLIAEPGAKILGDGKGNVVTITAARVTVRGFHITGSGLNLSNDDAAVFVAGNSATIENNVIEESLHGVYLKKVSDARVIGNCIRGKKTLKTETKPVEQTLTAGIGDLCEVPLNENERGNGIHQWNCERNFISGNDISDTRDGIYFSFTNHTRVESNSVHNVRYGLHYMYSDDDVFEKNLFTENAAGAAIMFSRNIIIRDNRFLDNRGSRAYGILFQSDDMVRVENNVIRNNAVGLSFQQAIGFVVEKNELSDNYIGLRFYGNSDNNSFTENRITRNLHPVDVDGEGTNNRWAVNGIGNFWGEETVDLNHDGIGDLPHRELDLFGPIRHAFPAIAFLSGSPIVRLLRFANERAAIPGLSAIEDPAPLTADFWKLREGSPGRASLSTP